MTDQSPPTEPGWYQSPDDSGELERWWTGIEWSEYTRAVASPTGDDQVDATTSIPTNPASDAEQTDDSAAGPIPAVEPTPSIPAASDTSAFAEPVEAPAPSGPLAFAAYQGDAADDESIIGVVGLLDRLRGADDGESGWDRNLATMAWLPLLSGLVLLGYVLSGAHMVRHTRSHIAGAVNMSISNAIMALGIATISLSGRVNPALAIIWMMILGGLFGAVVYLLSSRDDTETGAAPYWIWFGLWAFVAFVCALDEAGSIVYVVVFGGATLVLMVVNAFRGRLGMGAKFFGYPVLPVLSRR